jgi:hypothetical protein
VRVLKLVLSWFFTTFAFPFVAIAAVTTGEARPTIEQAITAIKDGDTRQLEAHFVIFASNLGSLALFDTSQVSSRDFMSSFEGCVVAERVHPTLGATSSFAWTCDERAPFNKCVSGRLILSIMRAPGGGYAARVAEEAVQPTSAELLRFCAPPPPELRTPVPEQN